MKINIQEAPLAKFIFTDTKIAWLWLILRVYVGWEWLSAGWQKLGNPAWTGEHAGAAVQGFLSSALQKTAGAHPDVQSWYAGVIHFSLNHTVAFSYLITFGEITVGVALILGLLTGIAAFFGSFMNANYLLAGTVSVNPILLLAQILIILAWRVAGWYGVDKYLLPYLGTPWQKGKLFNKNV